MERFLTNQQPSFSVLLQFVCCATFPQLSSVREIAMCPAVQQIMSSRSDRRCRVLSLNKAALLDHHKKQEYCLSRKAYRNGRRKTAVKVFTVNDESKFIIVTNIHAIGLANDLVKTFSKFGTVTQCDELSDYPREPYTQVFLLKFDDIQSARIAKRKADEMYFFGSILHVFYAPEYETVNDTRDKLMKRRINVIQRLKSLAKADKNGGTSHCASSITASSSSSWHSANQSGIYSSMSSASIENVINPSLPQIIAPLSLKRRHCDGHMDMKRVENASSSSTQVEHLKPVRKKPKLLRLPGYVPPKNAYLAPD